MSTISTWALRPRARTIWAVSLAVAMFMSATTISAPRSAISLAWARPIPSPDPVINATLPASAFMGGVLSIERNGWPSPEAVKADVVQLLFGETLDKGGIDVLGNIGRYTVDRTDADQIFTGGGDGLGDPRGRNARP